MTFIRTEEIMKHSLYWLAGLTLLSACTPPTTPTTEKPLGNSLYQVDFQIKDQSTATATMQQLGAKASAGLNAQNLTALPDTLEINTKPVAVSTFITKKNGVDIRHVHSTFTITNNTAQPLNNLMFLPVMRSDADSDPTNNPETPTVAGTPFLNIRLFDGTDASSQAASLQTTQAQDVDVRTGEAVLNTSASQYLTGLDVSGVTLPATPGMTKTVLNNGWYAARSLAPGASTNVTLAVELPVNLSQPETQPFSFSIVLTAAQDVTGSSVGPALDPARIRGIIQNWTFGTGENLHANYGGYGALNPVVSNIASDGAVDGMLSVASLQPFFGRYCTFSGEQTAPDVNIAVPQLNAMSGAGDPLGQVVEQTANGSTIFRIYSDATAKFNGTVSCSYGQTININVSLTRGWNTLSGNLSANPGTLVNLPLGAKTTLSFIQAAETVGVSITDWSAFTLYAGGSSVSRAVQFVQGGGISGDLTLETSVPGITVSPSSITLPSLNAASLNDPKLNGLTRAIKTQALTTSIAFTAAENAPTYNGSLDLIVKKNGVEVGRTTINNVSVIVPYVMAAVNYPYNASYSYPPNYLVQGTTVVVPVTVSSQNNFAGTTTITFINLPAGVTASTENVTLTSGSSATANITLTASSTATLGAFAATLSGPKYINQGYSDKAYLQVVLARVVLGLSSVSQTAPASQGVWVLGRDSSNITKLVRVQGNAVVQQEVVNTVGVSSIGSIYLIETVLGDVITVVTGGNINTPYLFDTMVVTLYRTDGSRLIQTLTGVTYYRGVADSNSDLWFEDMYSSPTLKYLDMSTGAVEPVAVFGNSSSALVSSPDGLKLFILLNGSTQTVNTTTRTISAPVALGSFISPSSWSANALIATNSGTLYSADSGGSGGIYRIDPNGQVSPLPLSSTSRVSGLYGLDRANANILWIAIGTGVTTVDLTTGALTTKDSQSISGGSVNLTGGFWELTGDFQFPNTPYSVSYLK